MVEHDILLREVVGSIFTNYVFYATVSWQRSVSGIIGRKCVQGSRLTSNNTNHVNRLNHPIPMTAYYRLWMLR